jgi:hypothetical protein
VVFHDFKAAAFRQLGCEDFDVAEIGDVEISSSRSGFCIVANFCIVLRKCKLISLPRTG